MKKLFPIALIAFIAVLGTSCKKEVQEAPETKSAFKAEQEKIHKASTSALSIESTCTCYDCKPQQIWPPR